MARRVTTEAERHLRDKLKLVQWLEKDDDRKRIYFEGCDEVLAKLRKILQDDGDDPPDDAVVIGVMAAVKVDDTLSAWVDKKKGDFFNDQANWDALHHATAAVIYHEYLVAVEKGRWHPS